MSIYNSSKLFFQNICISNMVIMIMCKYNIS